MYTALTFKQKQLIYDEYQRRKREGADAHQKDLAAWAKTQFSLPSEPSQATISRVLATMQKDVTPRAHLIHKRDRHGKNHALEEALFAWISQQQGAKKAVNGAAIREKALAMQGLVNERLPKEGRLDMKFSNGWLTRFHSRWGLTAMAMRARSAEKAGNVAAPSLEGVKQVLKEYKLADIWSADELGLMYNVAPSKSVSRTQLYNPQMETGRITCLACCNADGSEKFPLMIVGKRARPASFEGKTGKELGFDYHTHERASMTAFMFYEWLHRFDHYIGAKGDREVVLLIDSCSAHGIIHTRPPLNAVKVVLLPDERDSSLLPFEVGLSETIKLRYRIMQMDRVQDLMDCGVSHIYNVDQLTAMRWISVVWNELPIAVIMHAWRGTKLIDNESGLRVTDAELKMLKKEKIALAMLISQTVGSADRMPMDQFLNSAIEQECTEHLSDDYLVNTVVNTVSATDAADNELSGGDDVKEPFPFALSKQLEIIAAAKVVIQAKFPNRAGAIDDLQMIQKELRIILAASAEGT